MRYKNPVYDSYFADPFVLRVDNDYWAYGTAPAPPDVRPFPVLHSSDLVHWSALGGSLQPLENPPALTYWAPEVVEFGGQFYMFYSSTPTHSDEHHRIRVAIADHPAGPFVDVGRELMPQYGFTIDASPFRDPRDGKWYLFFATDFETDEPYGTGLGVVSLADDLLSISGEPRTVARASAPWQIYERNRDYKGRVWPAWNCVEGPSALYHEGRYYCFYSGGAWHGDNYGVGYAVADHPLGPWRDAWAARGPAVLKGIPGSVIGPGHNSVVLGPDNARLFMVYHAWDAEKTARRMFIDPIVWTGEGPKVDGPSVGNREV